ncbi:MAG: hypothetical protein PHD23_10465 [Eubacteriales bacterium]|nr:hypothetical protein [Eubacteriales bacterium]
MLKVARRLDGDTTNDTANRADCRATNDTIYDIANRSIILADCLAD